MSELVAGNKGFDLPLMCGFEWMDPVPQNRQKQAEPKRRQLGYRYNK
jgi:hypothetical protein